MRGVVELRVNEAMAWLFGEAEEEKKEVIWLL